MTGKVLQDMPLILVHMLFYGHKKKTIIALSKEKVEYLAATSASCQEFYLRRMLEELMLEEFFVIMNQPSYFQKIQSIIGETNT